MRYLLTLAALLILSSFASAACSGSSPTWTAASTSSADVQACFNAAIQDGNTINIPAGTSTWTVATNPPCKSITVAGAGSSSTHIIVNIISGFGNDAFFLTGCSGKQQRYTAMDLQYESADSFGIFMFTGGTGLSLRVDHNTIEPFPTTPGYGRWMSFRVPCISPGCVFDHNTITDEGSIIENLQSGDSTQAPTNGAGGLAWVQTMPFETVNAVYYENNTISNPTIATHQVDVTDCDDGGAYVFRHNAVGEGTIGNHGFDSVVNGCRMQNEYVNTLTQTSATAFGVQYRGGTGVVYQNTFAGGSTANTPFAITNYRSDSLGFVGSTGNGHCDGTNAFDSNLNVPVSVGYHCRSQIGMGSGAANGWDSQPLYEWDNCKTSLGCTGTGTQIQQTLFDPAAGTWWGPQEIVQNRDYYDSVSGFTGATGVGIGVLASRPATCTKGVAYWATDASTLTQCTATNTWSAFYAPFTYPHPLAATQATAPSCSPSTPYTGPATTDSITDSNTGTHVTCYTTNGSTPATAGNGTSCTTGTVYTTPIAINSTLTVNAISGTSTLIDSTVASCAYTITSQTLSGQIGNGTKIGNGAALQ